MPKSFDEQYRDKINLEFKQQQQEGRIQQLKEMLLPKLKEQRLAQKKKRQMLRQPIEIKEPTADKKSNKDSKEGKKDA